MLRTMSRATRVLTTVAAAAAVALPAVARAQDNRPVVVVFAFDNNSIGPSSGEFAGIRTGVQDLLITDMASNAKVRLVDRAHIAEIMQEQNMVKGNQIDPQTAVRLGKLLGAQYAVTGGFMADAKGNAILTGRTIDIETSQIANPEKIQGKADDVMGMIGQLSSKLNGNMNLAPKPARRVGDAGDAAKSAPAQSGQPAATKSAAAPASNVEQYAKPVTKSVKLDGASLKLYSNALDEMDKKNTAKAKQLLQQVAKAYPDFEPAQRQLKKIG